MDTKRQQDEANGDGNLKPVNRRKNRTRSRFNAVKHGLLAVGLTEIDDAKSYFALLDKLKEQYDPVGELENFLVERLAFCITRIRRSVKLESQAITSLLHPERRSKSRIDQQMEEQWAAMGNDTSILEPGFDPQLRADDVGNLADALGRYETLHERRLYRAMQELEHLQKTRQAGRIVVNKEVIPTPGCQIA
jgi:hypothetical protein